MFNFFKNKIVKDTNDILYDRSLIWIALGLLCIGFIMVTSSSIPVSLKLTNGEQMFRFSIKHAIFIAVALSFGIATLNISIARWEQLRNPVLLGSFLLLVLVLILGHTVNGATRWIRLGFINIQPAEVAKLSIFIFTAGYLDKRQEEVVESIKGFIKPLVVFGLMALLLIMQPDFGSVVVMFITILAMLFVAGAKLWQFIALVTVGLVVVTLLIYFEPYRLERMATFVDPWKHPFGSGYQLTQSLMAFGRGGWFGQGLGNSVQKLAYLPEAHTDFVFAVLAEELGFIGVTLVLMLVSSLVIKALLISFRCLKIEQQFSGFLALAIGIWFAFQTVVNVGASAGIVPTKGLTLPLVSYGGSSLVVMCIAVAILIRIDYEYRLATAQAYTNSK